MEEARLIEKLKRIEALFAGATTEGEREAAEAARGRILNRLRSLEREDPPIEFRFTMSDVWSRKIFLALIRRYGLHPYRYRGQRRTTVMVRVSKRFVDETLWPEYLELAAVMRTHLEEITDRIVTQVLHGDSADAAEVDVPPQLESR